MARPRAVITGLGVVSPLGLDLVSFWDGLRQHRSGVRLLTSFDASLLPVRFGGEVDGFDARKYLDKQDRKRLTIMVRSIRFAVAASQLAMDDAHLARDQIDPARFGVVFGSSTIPSNLEDLAAAGQASVNPGEYRVDERRWGEQGIALIPPMWMLGHIPNMAASHVSIIQNAQGPNNTITQSELGATLAVGEALRHIRNRRADLFLVGGGDDMITPIGFVRYLLHGDVSHHNEDPAAASRPFDRLRDGRVLGEGGGVVVMEELEHARRRGARIYAEVVGFGAGFDGVAPEKSLARAIRIALAQAEITPAEIDHINAHGISIQEEDVSEAAALVDVFGRPSSLQMPPPVLALKSRQGTLGAGSAPVELAASLLALENGVLPANLNCEHPDPACPLNLAREPQPIRKAHFLKITRTELGQAAAIVCRKWERD